MAVSEATYWRLKNECAVSGMKLGALADQLIRLGLEARDRGHAAATEKTTMACAEN